MLESGEKLTERGLSCVDIVFFSPPLAAFATPGAKKPGVQWSEGLGAKCTVDFLRYIYYLLIVSSNVKKYGIKLTGL